MHRVLLLFLLIQSYSASHHGLQKRFREDDNEFLNFSLKVKTLDEEARRICNANDVHLKETYCNNYYKLDIFLPGFTEDNIRIRIKGRVLFVQAFKTSRKIFSELKMLPELVNKEDAAWSFKEGQLIIKMMYHVSLGKGKPNECSVVVGDKVIDVPKKELDAGACVDEKRTSISESVV